MSITGTTKIQYLLEMNISGATSAWVLDQSVVGVGTILLDGPVTSVILGSIPRVMGGSVTRGRTDEFTTIPPGTMTVTADNADGRFSPWNPSSPFYPNLAPNRQIRISARFDPATAWKPLFFGYVESITPQANGPVDANVVLTANDWLERANNSTVSASYPRQGDSDRVLAILGSVGIDNLPFFSMGDPNNEETLLPSIYADATGKQMLDEVANSTRGTFYHRADGTLIYRPRAARFTSQGTFRTKWFFDQVGLTSDPRAIPYADDDTGYGLDIRTIKTAVSVQSGVQNEPAGVASDGPATTSFGNRTLSIAAPLLAEGCAGCMADALLDAYKGVTARITHIKIDCSASPQVNGWIDDLLALELGDTVTVYQRQPANLNVAANLFVEQIRHDWDGEGGHVVTLQLSDQRLFGPSPWIVGVTPFDTATNLTY
jgi:hypothetical protein